MADDYQQTPARVAGLQWGQSSGSIETAGDRDWFAVTLTGGQAYAFSLNSLGLNDPYVRSVQRQWG
ncbi:MAG: hypothetical protein IPJ38_16040 [Dechloromonas sp.]|uniref:Uncharacterized protein n=1 Tax=Candidatus Dechloromonas phosphorivorans TaxID=2899244 RepID=A0A935K1A4_9RHOO|nr:hypothetical protein [Candidatus Dechloromonas phosphorivorans]